MLLPVVPHVKATPESNNQPFRATTSAGARLAAAALSFSTMLSGNAHSRPCARRCLLASARSRFHRRVCSELGLEVAANSQMPANTLSKAGSGSSSMCSANPPIVRYDLPHSRPASWRRRQRTRDKLPLSLLPSTGRASAAIWRLGATRSTRRAWTRKIWPMPGGSFSVVVTPPGFPVARRRQPEAGEDAVLATVGVMHEPVPPPFFRVPLAQRRRLRGHLLEIRRGRLGREHRLRADALDGGGRDAGISIGPGRADGQPDAVLRIAAVVPE